MMMMFKRRPTKNEVVAKSINGQKRVSRAIVRLDRAIDRLYSNYALIVENNVSRTMTKTEAMNAAAAARMISDLTGILQQSGFEDTISDYVDTLGTARVAALDYFTIYGLSEQQALAGVPGSFFDAYVRHTEGSLRQELNKRLAGQMQQAILDISFGLRTRAEVLEQVESTASNMRPDLVKVMVDDSVQRLYRGVTTEAATHYEMDIFQYLGPNDEITSPQCELMLEIDEHGVPGMLFKDEITQSLHPNLRRDPLTGGGHPRCRHHWSPVTVDYAESLGFKVPDSRKKQEAA